MGNNASTTGYSRLHQNISLSGNIVGQDKEVEFGSFSLAYGLSLAFFGLPLFLIFVHATSVNQQEGEQKIVVKANGELIALSKILTSQSNSNASLRPETSSRNKVVAQPIVEQKSEDTLERRLADLKLKVVTLQAEYQQLYSLMKKQEKAIEKINEDNTHLHKRIGESTTLTNHQMVAAGSGPSKYEANNSVPDLIDLGPTSTSDVKENKGLKFELMNPINDHLLMSIAPIEPNSSQVNDLTGCLLVLIFLIAIVIGLLL